MKIQPIVFDFLLQLEQNNNREWFAKNRSLYDESLSIISVFTDELIKRIAEFDSSVLRETSKTSIFRIYRDIRFSPNKVPYKNHFGIYIVNGGKSSKYAGYYVHIEPNKSMLAGGLWCPEKEVLSKIREDIYYNPETLLSILNQNKFKQTFKQLSLEGKLKKPPKGYSTEFEHIDLIQNKHYIIDKSLTNEEILNDEFINHLVNLCKIISPLNNYLNSIIQYKDE